jgi:hypothetical protein
MILDVLITWVVSFVAFILVVGVIEVRKEWKELGQNDDTHSRTHSNADNG